jgi:hypothetical protein
VELNERIAELYKRVDALNADAEAVYLEWHGTSPWRNPVRWWKLSLEHERLCLMHSKYCHQLLELV